MIAVSQLKVDLYKQLSDKVLAHSAEANTEMSHTELKNLMKAQPEFDIRSFVPSISIRYSEYDVAIAELNAIVTSSQEESNYIEAQKIYVDFLSNGRTEVSPSQLQFLRNAGFQEGRLNAYPRTILYLIAGERLERTVPFADPSLEERSRKAALNRTISCYPNPVQQSSIYLVIEENENTSYDFKLSDMSGSIIYIGQLESNKVKVIDSAELSSGIYILTISDKEENIIHLDKIVVTE